MEQQSKEITIDYKNPQPFFEPKRDISDVPQKREYDKSAVRRMIDIIRENQKLEQSLNAEEVWNL